MPVKILFFGDIMGKIGRKGLVKVLPELKEKYLPDLTIANAENLAHGAGVTGSVLEEMKNAGIDCFTSGNHVWDKPEVNELIAKEGLILLRPANYPQGVPGIGDAIVKAGKKSILLINLMGRVFFREHLDDPFRKADEILKKYEKEKLAGIIVDFHAEATSEKNAMGLYLDGRASAVLCTHTHVPTADARVLPQGTAYITDLGMVGAKDSVIGVAKEGPLKQFLTQLPATFDIPEKGTCVVNGACITLDEKTGNALSIERVQTEVDV